MENLNTMKRRCKSANDSWKPYYQYIVERAEYWIERGDQEWPNAIAPKAESIEMLAVSRAEQEADQKFNVVREDVGIDAEGRYL